MVMEMVMWMVRWSEVELHKKRRRRIRDIRSVVAQPQHNCTVSLFFQLHQCVVVFLLP